MDIENLYAANNIVRDLCELEDELRRKENWQPQSDSYYVSINFLQQFIDMSDIIELYRSRIREKITELKSKLEAL